MLHLSSHPVARTLRLVSLTGLLSAAACGGGGAEPPDETKDASTPAPDAKVIVTGAPDAQPDPAPKVTLDTLAGKYLLRFDSVGTTSSGTALAVRSRVSLLWLTELKVDGAKLKASERLCTQVTTQMCKTGCATSSTVIDPKVISDFFPKKSFERTYTLGDDGTFTGEAATAPLGYDDSGSGALPTMPSDSRLWDVLPGGDREGVLTSLTLTGVGVPLINNVQCQVYGVQKLVSRFHGTLQGSALKPTIPSMPLDLSGSDGNTVGFTGDPLCSATSGASSPVESGSVRMVRYDSGPALDCKDLTDFDKLLPPDPL